MESVSARGGTLATVLTLAARDAGVAQPLLQVLLYPCTRGHQHHPSHPHFARGHLLEADTLQWMYAHCLRNEADRRDWRFAPLEAASLRGLAPAFVALADHDPLLDEGRACAERLAGDGVPTEVKVYAGMVHDFARLGNIVEEPAGRVRRDVAKRLAKAFGER